MIIPAIVLQCTSPLKRLGDSKAMVECAVIGAGIAGLAAAQTLHLAGHSVVVLEKSRGLGGRAATRRVEGVAFDHGAQYFTVQSPRFEHWVATLRARGVVRLWAHGFHRLEGGRLQPPEMGRPRYSCPSGMNTLGKVLAEELTVYRETEIIALKRTSGGWELRAKGGMRYHARSCLVAIPAPQALALVRSVADKATLEQLAQVVMRPCYALALGFGAQLELPFVGVTLSEGPLAWVAHDSSKRESPSASVLMLHSTPEFAEQHLEARPERVAAMLRDALRQSGLVTAEPAWENLQRWRYSLVESPLARDCLEEEGLVLAGEWCGGARIEAAYLSGLAAAAALRRQLR